jgi:hypothetical protein
MKLFHLSPSNLKLRACYAPVPVRSRADLFITG